MTKNITNNAANPYEAGVRRSIPLPHMELTRLIDEAIIKFRDRECTEFMGRTITYTEMGQIIAQTAKGLQDMGVGPGTRFGLYMPNTPWYPILFFAALKTGATVVNFDLSHTPEKLAAQIKDSNTTFMVVTELPEYKNNLAAARGDTLQHVIECPIAHQLPFIKSLGFHFKMAVQDWRVGSPHIDFGTVRQHGIQSIIKNDGRYRSVHCRPDDIAVLQYTGGTTGMPKGAMLSHKNLVANALQIKEFYAREGKDADNPRLLGHGEDVTLAALPFFHVYSMTVGMLMSMMIGAKTVILPDPQDLKTYVKALNNKKPTIVPVVPKQLRALLDKKDSLPDYDFKSVKVFISGGAALPPDLKREFEQATNTMVLQGYGLSETSPVLSGHSPLVASNDDDSVGFPLPMTEIRFIALDDDTENGAWRDVPDGETGEICVRGPQVMRGYLHHADTKATMRDGWFRTGDIGHRGPDGQIYITDRLKDMIIINGKKIFPLEVEKKILRHPAIAECNIVNVTDRSTGEAAMAFIRFKPGVQPLNDGELRAFFDEIPLSKLEKPKHITVWTEELPKTRVGKPDKKELRQIANRLLAERHEQGAPAAPHP